MWFAGAVVCHLLSQSCGVSGFTKPDGAAFETRAQCEEVLQLGLPKLVEKYKIEDDLLAGKVKIGGGCLERPADWKPVPLEFMQSFAPPLPAKKKEQDA